jgi:hypothetical protein
MFEVAIAGMGIVLAASRKKIYGWGIALTYIIYVIYDTAKFFDLTIKPEALYIVFFMATLSMLWAVWRLVMDTPHHVPARPEKPEPHHVADEVQKSEEF